MHIRGVAKFWGGEQGWFHDFLGELQIQGRRSGRTCNGLQQVHAQVNSLLRWILMFSIQSFETEPGLFLTVLSLNLILGLFVKLTIRLRLRKLSNLNHWLFHLQSYLNCIWMNKSWSLKFYQGGLWIFNCSLMLLWKLSDLNMESPRFYDPQTSLGMT